MWEIPILKWVENRQVKAELAKRQGMPANKNIKKDNRFQSPKQRRL